jgi:nucleotide-binding universal stress UspA family protein
MNAPVIVGVDRSDTARRAVFVAAQIATSLDAPLHLVTAVHKTDHASVRGTGTDEWNVDWLTRADQFLAALKGEISAPEVTSTISLKDPATALCEAATELDARMIVVGNRRVQGLSRVLGSIASTVARNAPCDVLITNTAN